MDREGILFCISLIGAIPRSPSEVFYIGYELCYICCSDVWSFLYNRVEIASVTEAWVIMLPGLLVSLLSGIVLVFRTTDKSGEHWTLRNEFIELEKNVISALDEDVESIKELQRERLDIESREPKILRMLDVMLPQRHHANQWVMIKTKCDISLGITDGFLHSGLLKTASVR